MAGRSATSDEIKKACDAFFERRGEKKRGFREMVNHDARDAVRKRRLRKETLAEKVAREIEENSKE
jgi:hypothetical protein